MIINGCVVKIGTDDEEIVDGIAEFLEYNNINDEIENETLGYLASGVHRIEVSGNDETDFELSIIVPGEGYSQNYRFIADSILEDVFLQHCEENFDDDAWREDVANYNTEDSMDEWKQYKEENTPFEEAFSTYDESYHDELDNTKFHVFRL